MAKNNNLYAFKLKRLFIVIFDYLAWNAGITNMTAPAVVFTGAVNSLWLSFFTKPFGFVHSILKQANLPSRFKQ
jgi:hypothetical protein